MVELSQKSKILFEKAKKLIPGGVNSPVRAFKPYPFFTAYAKGSKIYDIDENAYIDYCMAYGALILGHAYPEIIEAIKQQLEKGTIYGTPTEIEVEFAELITKTVPSIEKIRLVNTGTEATMHAIRLARGYTNRDKIIKLEGCYHGSHDYVLVKAGSSISGPPVASSLGIPEDSIKNTIVLPFNDIESLNKTIEKNKDEIAAVILEPVIGNAGVILPKNGYLNEVRKITKDEGIILIFDEVITGFRLALGGAQEYYGVIPDMTILGKIIGGGLPLAAFGGKNEIMELLAPSGKVYQAGTFSGNPVSVTAGLTTLKILINEKNRLYSRLKEIGEKIKKGIIDILESKKLSAQVNGIASMFQIFFTNQAVIDYATAQTSDKNKYLIFHQNLLKHGIFFPPSQFETCFISSAHTDEDVVKTLEAIEFAIKSLV
jgi:glutamate-1-semialdehyde 2,1-aminomutase